MDLKDLPASERSKIAALLKKDTEQNDISWMYNQPQVDKEAFLLGKEVTSIDQIEKLGQDYEESPAQRLARIDMEAKFREDPLTVMKQREAEKRMELLRNTAKVKKLRRLLTMQKHRTEKKRKRKHAEKRQKGSRSKNSTSSSSSSSSDSSSGDELLDKFIKIVRQSDEIDSKNVGEEHRKHKKSKSHHEKRPVSSEKDQHPSTSHSHRSGASEQKTLSPRKLEAHREKNASVSDKDHKPSASHSDHSRVSEHKTLSREEFDSHHERRSETSRHDRNQSKSRDDRSRVAEQKKLTREELEARRIQMMIDAKEHEKNRIARASHHYRQKQEQEALEAEARSRHGASFISEIKNDHAQRSTIEEGVHRKASSRQRGELSSNFLKR